MGDAPVLFDVRDKIGRITLNRPNNRNSMDQEVLPAFREIIQNVKRDRELRCLIITGSGSTFCAGADFRSSLGSNYEGLMVNEVFLELYRPFLEVGELEVPTIAALNGHAIGGGFGLALICDIRVANKKARYGANFSRLGLHSGMAISYMLPRLVGLPVACELLFTGRIINGDRAAKIGLVNYAVDEGDVLIKSMELAAEIADSAPVAVRMMKKSIYRGLDWNAMKAAEAEAHCQSRTFEMEDAREGISALLEKRKPDFKGR
jgi:enoyl-CoA hydratase/carnithine racemase